MELKMELLKVPGGDVGASFRAQGTVRNELILS